MFSFILGAVIGFTGTIVLLAVLYSGDDPCEDCIIKEVRDEINNESN